MFLPNLIHASIKSYLPSLERFKSDLDSEKVNNVIMKYTIDVICFPSRTKVLASPYMSQNTSKSIPYTKLYKRSNPSK